MNGLILGDRNLIVGRNASGKSRILNIIASLAKQLAGLMPPSMSGDYECEFVHGAGIYRYEVKIAGQKVYHERVIIDGDVMLSRGPSGEGEIRYERVEGKTNLILPFQSPNSAFAAAVRRDAVQHSFLEPLFLWASSVRHYQFGTPLGKDALVVIVPSASAPLDERDANATVPIFRQAEKQFGQRFIKELAEEFARVEYHVSEIGAKAPVSMQIMGLPGEVISIFVKENDLPGVTDQNSMSQGMYRTLAILTHLKYCEMKNTATCVLIDDIGEGLDFDRSWRLIDLLREKAEKSKTQLILSTNDRFVMNHVPLEEWSVIQRKGNHVEVKNFINSRHQFEEFKFTGLSNFSFFETDFINEPADAVKH